MSSIASFEKYSKKIWIGAFALVGFIILFFVILSFQGLPDFKQLESPDFELATQVIDVKSREIGRYYTQNRLPVDYDHLNPHLIDALVATEDVRFFAHSGVDVQALSRVFLGVVTFNRNKGGGSTITQQLAKLLYSDRDFSNMGAIRKTFALVNIKLKEWITAIKLERSYTKEEIIAMYLNKFNFIYGAYGIEAASETYFSKGNKELNESEAAVLVGMLKNPSLYNPVRRKEQAINRRNTVLRRMVTNGALDAKKAEKLIEKPIELKFKPKSHIEGDATYFRMEVGKEVASIIKHNDLQKSDGSLYDIYRDGLKIYTSIDVEMQKIAEATMLKHMKSVQNNYWREWKGKDPWKYNTDAKQLAIRENTMKNLVRSSDRYITMRQNDFEPDLEGMMRKFPSINFTDIEFDIWSAAEKDGLEKVAKKYKITDDQERIYAKIMDDPDYKIALAKWQKFRNDVRTSFGKKYKLKVFAYNAMAEKDTTMTPYDSIRYHRSFLQTGIIALEPTKGRAKV